MGAEYEQELEELQGERDRVTALRLRPDHCITCGDEGVPMRVRARRRRSAGSRCARTPTATRTTVEIALVAPVAPGDALLVHAGTALARSPAEARA